MGFMSYYGSHKHRIVTSVKMASLLLIVVVSLLIAVSLVVSENDNPFHLDSTLPPSSSDPFFEDGEGPVNVTARIGCNVYLDCSFPVFQEHNVTWLHRKAESISILTFNKLAYTYDRRITLNFRDPKNFRLSIANVSRRDEGLYECQVFTLTALKKVKQVFLKTVEHDALLYSETASESPVTTLPSPSTTEPYFYDDDDDDEPANITVPVGFLLIVYCNIGMLQGYHVSWVYRRLNSDYPVVLTFDKSNVSSDRNITVRFNRFEHIKSFDLRFDYISRRHEGLYECQISTTPKKIKQIFLKVNEPIITIRDENNHESAAKKYYKAGNTVELTCAASRLEIPGENVTWWRDGVLVADGVSYSIDDFRTSIESTLVLHDAQQHHSGNYTCSVINLVSASVYVHILNSTACQINEYSQVK